MRGGALTGSDSDGMMVTKAKRLGGFTSFVFVGSFAPGTLYIILHMSILSLLIDRNISWNALPLLTDFRLT